MPTQGAISGLLKSLAREWPAVRIRAVDLDLDEPTALLATNLLAECGAGDEQVEIGYRDGRRLALEPVIEPLSSHVELMLDQDAVVLITGGARGITADAALELAERYHPTLVLAGRSPLPQPEEDPETIGKDTARELKAILIARRRASGQSVTPIEIEHDYQGLLNEREIRETLRALREHGATVEYHAVDVRDEQTFGALIEATYARHGRIDGVIHGAGIIEDKLLKDKTAESFDRVVRTKVESAWVLSRYLRPSSLRFLVFFSSVAGRFGNRGQSDYAAANEVLNKLALYLDQRWPARVVSINWGPWEKRGMVSAELQQAFAQRGLALVPAAEGRRMFDAELRQGTKGDVEVVIAGSTKQWATAVVETDKAYPLMSVATARAIPDGVEVTRIVDVAHDLYLDDHRLDGKPVLPFAVAMELMAEVVQDTWSSQQVIALHDMQIFKGIVLEQGPKRIRIVARLQPPANGDAVGTLVDVEITDVDSPNRPHYRAVLELGSGLPDAMSYRVPAVHELQPFGLSIAEAYGRWLFHGPMFEGIASIAGIAEDGIVATLRPSSPRELLADAPRSRWLIDPVVFDSGLQMIILWTRTFLDMTPLPARFRSYRRYGPVTSGPITCHVEILRQPGAHIFIANVAFVDASGRLVGMLEGMECPSSKALNRLAGTGQYRGGAELQIPLTMHETISGD